MKKQQGKPLSDKTRKPYEKSERSGRAAPGKPTFKKEKQTDRKTAPGKKKAAEEGIRLNRYIANAGICSRREADVLIEAGAFTINGKIITKLGTHVLPGDVVKYSGKTLFSEKLRYILLNKPKGYITTTDDPQERKTVMMLIKNACSERVYPVGRLDRNTTGLLLFTNDGEMAKKLTHPSHRVEKVYHVVLDKPLSKKDMLTISGGIALDDGQVKADSIAWAGDGTDKREVGIVIHSGKNRIVRRIFEAMNYEVVRLDRVAFASLTKKNLPRGHWRMLTPEEVNVLRRIH
jgi:23S rRNA pseudouridine2605 synthase